MSKQWYACGLGYSHYSVLSPVHTGNNVKATFDFVTKTVGKTDNIVAETGKIVAKNSNHVEETFDFVERIVRLVAFDNVASTVLLVWTGLKTL